MEQSCFHSQGKTASYRTNVAHSASLGVSVDEEKAVTIRGTREALTMISNVISTLSEADQISVSLAPGAAGGDLLSATSSGLTIVREGPRRSTDYKKIGTYDAIRGIYDIPPEK